MHQHAVSSSKNPQKNSLGNQKANGFSLDPKTKAIRDFHYANEASDRLNIKCSNEDQRESCSDEGEDQRRARSNIFQSDEENSCEGEELSQEEIREKEEYEEDDMVEMADQEELERYVKNFQEEIEVKFNASEVNGVYKMPRDIEDSESSSRNSSMVSLKNVTKYDLEEQNLLPREKENILNRHQNQEIKKSKQSPQRLPKLANGLQKKIMDEYGNIYLSNEDLKNDELSVLTALSILENVENVAFESVTAKLKDKNSPLYHALYRIVEENMKKSEGKIKKESAGSPNGQETNLNSPPQVKTHKKQAKSGNNQGVNGALANKGQDGTSGIKGATKLDIKKVGIKKDRDSVCSQHQRRQPSYGKGNSVLKYASREETLESQGGGHSNMKTAQNRSSHTESSKHNSREGKTLKPGNLSAYHMPKGIQYGASFNRNIGNLSYLKGNLDNSNEGRPLQYCAPLSYGSKPPTPSAKHPAKTIAKHNKNRPFNFQNDHFLKADALKTTKSHQKASGQSGSYIGTNQHVNNLLKTVQESSMRSKGVMKNRREKMIASSIMETSGNSQNFKKEGLKDYRHEQHKINVTKQNETNLSQAHKKEGNSSELFTHGETSNLRQLKVSEKEGTHGGTMLLGGSSASSLRSNETSGNSSLERAPKKNAKESAMGGNGSGNYSKLSSNLLSKLKNTANFEKNDKQNLRNSTKTTGTPSTVNPSFHYNLSTNHQKAPYSQTLGLDSQAIGKKPHAKSSEKAFQNAPGSKVQKTKNPRQIPESLKLSIDPSKGARSPTGHLNVKQLFQTIEYH